MAGSVSTFASGKWRRGNGLRTREDFELSFGIGARDVVMGM